MIRPAGKNPLRLHMVWRQVFGDCSAPRHSHKLTKNAVGRTGWDAADGCLVFGEDGLTKEKRVPEKTPPLLEMRRNGRSFCRRGIPAVVAIILDRRGAFAVGLCPTPTPLTHRSNASLSKTTNLTTTAEIKLA